MPIITATPYTDESGDYPNLMVSLAISGNTNVANNDVTASVATRFKPYRVDEAGQIHLAPPEAERSFVVGDAFVSAQSDADLAQAVGTIMYAIQQLVTAKGI